MSCSRCSSHHSVTRTARPSRPNVRAKQSREPGDDLATQEMGPSINIETTRLSSVPDANREGTRFSAISRYEDDVLEGASPFMTPSESFAAALASADTDSAQCWDIQMPADIPDSPNLTSTDYYDAAARYPSIIAGTGVSPGDHSLVSPYNSYTARFAIESSFIFTAPTASTLPSIKLCPPLEGTVDMPVRAFVDDTTDWTYTLPDPFFLAPPAQTSSGRVLHPLEYDVMQASSYGHYSPLGFLSSRNEVFLNPYGDEDVLKGCTAIPSAFENEEDEDRLLYGSTSVVEVYVQEGLLRERPAAKLCIPPEVISTRSSPLRLDNAYDTDEEDDWEVVTPDAFTGSNPLAGSGGECTNSCLQGVSRNYEEREETFFYGGVRSNVWNLKDMASAARSLMARWRV